MNKIRFFITFLWMVTLTLFAFAAVGQTLSVKIYNKTEHHIDSFSIGNKHVGYFPKDSSIVLKMESFLFDSGYPYESMRGLIDGKTIENKWWSWCGAEREQKTEGNFTFELIRKDFEKDKSFLHLDYRRPPSSE